MARRVKAISKVTMTFFQLINIIQWRRVAAKSERRTQRPIDLFMSERIEWTSTTNLTTIFVDAIHIQFCLENLYRGDKLK